MKIHTSHVISLALAGLLLMGGCASSQQEIYVDDHTSPNYAVCPTELNKLAKNVQDVAQAKAAIRGYFSCRKDAKVAEPAIEAAVHDALTRNAWPTILRERDAIEAYFFDRKLVYKAPSLDQLSTWVQMLRDRKLLAQAHGDRARATALDTRIMKGEFAEYVSQAGHEFVR
jgi:hypothetical protein